MIHASETAVAKKKSTHTSKSAKKVAKKPAVKKKAAAKKVATSKKTAKKKTAKKTAKKKVAAKPAAAKTAKTTKKKTTTKTAKKVTKKTATKKKAASTKTATTSAFEADDAPRKPIKTHLSKKELLYYHNLLLVKRAELLGDMASMSEEALNSQSTDLSTMPIHMADVGSENHDKEIMLGLAESERKTVHEIDAALQRITDKTYGVCEETGTKIRKARLEAKPWAKYCIETARAKELRGTL